MKDNMEKDRDIIEKFTKAIYKSQQWIEKSSTEEIAKALLPSFADSDIELIKAVVENYKQIDVWKSDPVMLKEDYERLIDVITEAGIITSAPDFEKIIDNSIAEEVSSFK
jgi:NitT/TauT family transport system substrate-binding protein